MSRLNKVISDTNKAQNQTIINKPKKNTTIPQYNSYGRVVKAEKSKRQKRLLAFSVMMSVLLIFIYVPPIFINKANNQNTNPYIVQVDPYAIQLSNTRLSTSPTEDFDNDGIDNSREITENSNPWSNDTDFDGCSDYYELTVSKTSVYEYEANTIIGIQNKMDSDNNKQVSSPYKMDNVILWPNDINSRALGGVIKTYSGYYFYNYTGYAQFPNSENCYAYGIKGDTRVKLDYLEDENAWEINGVNEVEIYNEPLEEVIEYKLFTKTFYSKVNGFNNVMNFILPDNGFVAARKRTIKDVEPDTSHSTTAEIVAPEFDYNNTDRFATNTNSLANLQYVREMINNNKCVAVSLFDENDGEYIGIVYGYTYSGDLLIADYKTLEPIGKIYITEIGRKIIDKDTTFEYDTIFAWKGLGFSSSSIDRISFFAVSDSNINNMTGLEIATPTDATTPTDAPLEPPTEVTTEVTEATTTEVNEMTTMEVNGVTTPQTPTDSILQPTDTTATTEVPQ